MNAVAVFVTYQTLAEVLIAAGTIASHETTKKPADLCAVV
jgi:hypothetical protein